MYNALGPPAPVKKMRSGALHVRKGPETEAKREWVVPMGTRAEYVGDVSQGFLEAGRRIVGRVEGKRILGLTNVLGGIWRLGLRYLPLSFRRVYKLLFG